MTIRANADAPVIAAQSDHPLVYAADLGAGGIDFRCPRHLLEVMQHAEDLEYYPSAYGICEACDDDTADLHCDHEADLCRGTIGHECDAPPLTMVLADRAHCYGHAGCNDDENGCECECEDCR